MERVLQTCSHPRLSYGVESVKKTPIDGKATGRTVIGRFVDVTRDTGAYIHFVNVTIPLFVRLRRRFRAVRFLIS